MCPKHKDVRKLIVLLRVADFSDAKQLAGGDLPRSKATTIQQALKPNGKLTKASPPQKHREQETTATRGPHKPWQQHQLVREVAAIPRKGIFGQGKSSKAFGGRRAADTLPPDDELRKTEYNPYDIVKAAGAKNVPRVEPQVEVEVLETRDCNRGVGKTAVTLRTSAPCSWFSRC